jgi:hypothetical protein
MQHRKHTWVLIVIVTLALTGCRVVRGKIGYKPPAPVPLYVSVDTSGEVEFSAETEVDLPTPIGTFDIGIIVDPVEYFNKENVLTIRYNGEERFYDLHGQDFDLRFKSGCYKEITLAKKGSNLFLELVRECPVTIEIDNQSPKDICCVYISPCESDSWGSCWLADNEIIPAGRNRVFTVAAGCYDIHVVNCDNSTACESYGLQVYTSYI